MMATHIPLNSSRDTWMPKKYVASHNTTDHGGKDTGQDNGLMILKPEEVKLKFKATDIEIYVYLIVLALCLIRGVWFVTEHWEMSAAKLWVTYPNEMAMWAVPFIVVGFLFTWRTK